MFFFSKDKSEFNPQSLEHAYLAILDDNLDAAIEIFKTIRSPRAEWGISLCEIIGGHIGKMPTYFQIRNFLEIDIDFLLKNEKINYVEMLLGSLDYLSCINQEVYKFAARVMLVNNLHKAAQKYMEKSKKILYTDPELHFMLAKLYIEYKNYKQAYHYINECLTILPNYYPAKTLKEEISQYLLKNWCNFKILV